MAFAQRSHRRLAEEIATQSPDLVHAFVEDSNYTDIPIGQAPPVNKVMLIAKEESLHAKIGRNRVRRHGM